MHRKLNSIKNENFLMVKPCFRKENIHYLREEKQGYYSCFLLDKFGLGEIMIDPIAYFIMNLCDGARTIKNIIELVLEKYTDASEEIILEDLKKLLQKYNKIGLIKWEKGGNPFMLYCKEKLQSGLEIKFAEEYEIDEIRTFIINSIKKEEMEGCVNYLNPYLIEKEYSDLECMRRKFFSYSEEFVLIRDDSQIVGMISLRAPIHEKSTTYTIGVLRIEEKLISEIFEYIKKYLKEVAISDVYKIKFECLENNLSKFEECLFKCGFYNKQKNINEIGEADVYEISYIY